MKQIPASLLTLVAGIAIALISLWVGQNNGLLPEQASEQAPLVDNFFNVMVTIGTALFLVVEGSILIFVIKYRRRAGDDGDGLPVEGNLALEAFWTAIPAIIVIGLGVYSVAVFQEMGGLSPGGHGAMAHHHSSVLVAQAPTSSPIAGDVTPLIDNSTTVATADDILASPEEAKFGVGAPTDEIGKPPDLIVNVTGMQYAWLFNYPTEGVTAGELHVPIGKDVQLNLTGQDVIHSFWVPQFRLKQDVMPGEKSELRFVATKVGSYPVVCTELCGSYHGAMRSQVIVHPQDEYDQWLADNQIAQKSDHQAIAINPQDMTPTEFLTPYSDEMGVNRDLLAQLHH